MSQKFIKVTVIILGVIMLVSTIVTSMAMYM